MRGFRRVFLFPGGLPDVVVQAAREIPGVSWYPERSPVPNREHPRLVTSLEVRDLIRSLLRESGIPQGSWYEALEESAGPRCAPPDLDQIETARQPLPYQKEVVRYLLPKRGGLVDFPCGLGKTFTAILFSEAARQVEQRLLKTLIITRAITTYQWVGEIKASFGEKYKALVIEEGGMIEVRERKRPRVSWLLPTFQDPEGTPSLEGALDEIRSRILVRKTIEPEWRKPQERTVVKCAELLCALPCKAPNDTAQALALLLGLARLAGDAEIPWKRWGVYRKGTGECLEEHEPTSLYATALPATEEEVQQWGATARATARPAQERFNAAAKLYWYLWTQQRWSTRPDGKPAKIPVCRSVEGGGVTLSTVEDWTAEELEALERIGQQESVYRNAYAQWGKSTDHFAEYDFIVMSWGLLNNMAEVLKAWGPDLVIYDEAQYAKNHKHWRKVVGWNNEEKWERIDHVSAWAAYLSEDVRCPKYVLLLSATPAMNRMRDWWAICNLYNPRGMGSFYNFAMRYCGAYQGEYGLITSGASNVEEFNERIRHFVYKLEPGTADRYLPPLMTVHVRIPLSQAKVVRVSKGEYMAAKKRGSAALRELQLAINASAKEPYILRRVLEAAQDGERICVMTGRVAQVERLYQTLKKHLPADYGLWKVTGEEITSVDGRKNIVREYADAPKGGCLVATTESMGEAIDGLQCTNRAIVAMIPDTPGKFVQLRGRWRRLKGIPCELEILLLEESIDDDQFDLIQDKAEQLAQIQNSGALSELHQSLQMSQEDSDAILDRMAEKIVANMDRWTIQEDNDNAHHLGMNFTARVTGDADYGAC